MFCAPTRHDMAVGECDAERDDTHTRVNGVVDVAD
jgi:hypothetical protein